MSNVTKVCILGGGASGVGLLWCLAQAESRGLTDEQFDVTLIHDGDAVGGHSQTMSLEINDVPVDVDLGVQAIAPKMYPILSSMLAHPDFTDVELQDFELKLAMTFPPVDGETPYWGNFAGYQDTPTFKNNLKDAKTFQSLLSGKSVMKHPIEAGESLQTLLENNAQKFENQQDFETYILDPYLSIMNGYGAARLESLPVVEIAAFFDLGLASFTQPGEGFKRFKAGSQNWVKAMEASAKKILGDRYHPMMNTTVDSFYPSGTTPTVEWAPSKGTSGTAGQASFDAVISTLDMRSVSETLSKNNPMWDSLYAPRVGNPTKGDTFSTSVWKLVPGVCMLHQDPAVLSPGTPAGALEETLQFTGNWAIGDDNKYDIRKSFTTWIASNLVDVKPKDRADDWYLTMYGDPIDTFDPRSVPDHSKVKWEANWTHGMWLPTFMLEQKNKFHTAQSVSKHHHRYDGQEETNIFFAGNNLVMDSEEGALISGLGIAKYAFGIDPMATLFPQQHHYSATWALAYAEFEALYVGLMFPPHFPHIPGMHEAKSLMSRFLGLHL